MSEKQRRTVSRWSVENVAVALLAITATAYLALSLDRDIEQAELQGRHGWEAASTGDRQC